MSAGYTSVGWNRQKKIYDGVMLAGLIAYLALFLVLNALVFPEATAETALIRALGSAALILLHVILAIGPMARLDRRALPLLYNRRHLGVTMFFLGLAHGVFALAQFHAFGDQPILTSLFFANADYTSISNFPFQPLGFIALLILFLMAATSHDFWLANLTPPIWKTLHMGVYLAYCLLIAHVALGVLQAETHPLWTMALAAGLASILILHALAALKDRHLDRAEPGDGWVSICDVEEIPEDRARIITLAGERVAVFKYDGKVSAISNVCRHQNGPLGEGKVVDGCITCPWHGYQYRPDDGTSPPPFTEKVATFRVRLEGHRIQVHCQPLPAGTKVSPAIIETQE